MTSIVSYRKHTDAWTIYTLALPDNQADPAGGEDLRCTELATLDGVTYVAVPVGLTLPEQPEQITASVQQVELTPDLHDAIKQASPHCQFIAERVQSQIRARYTPEDEMYFARIGVGIALGEYTPQPGELERLRAHGAHVEACRMWGRDERAKLGL